MPASIRVIKIVKDYGGSEAYTLEFECTSDEAKDLLKELTSSPYGQRLIQLLNESKFLPELSTKTKDELKIEAEDEAKRIEENEERLKDLGRKDAIEKLFEEMKDHFGDDFVKNFELALDGKDIVFVSAPYFLNTSVEDMEEIIKVALQKKKEKAEKETKKELEDKSEKTTEEASDGYPNHHL